MAPFPDTIGAVGPVASQAYDFEPSAGRARFLDQRMRSELAASLRYLADKLEPHIPIDRLLFSSFLERLKAHSVSPLAFALYADVVFAIDNEDLPEANRLWNLLISQPASEAGLTIRELGDRTKDENSDRYIRYIDTDPEMSLEFFPPSKESSQSSRNKIRDALAFLEATDPALSAEIKELIREIMLCSGGAADSAKSMFDGASSFMLWGAILINADRPGDQLSMVQMLAHESAHNLLFGLCPDEPLLNNDRTERYASPLRTDLRPLEGIYHATFVTARMHRAIKRLADSGILSPNQKTTAEKDVEHNEKSFAQGMATLDKHADLTEAGRAIIEGARAYMNPFLKGH